MSRCCFMRNCLAVLAMVSMLAGLGCHRHTMIAHDGTEVLRPHDLWQAMNALDRLFSPEMKEALRSGEVESIELHHGVGTALRNNWGLWSGGSLNRWFRMRGIHHPDDMSAIILESGRRTTDRCADRRARG